MAHHYGVILKLGNRAPYRCMFHVVYLVSYIKYNAVRYVIAYSYIFAFILL